MRTKGGIKRVDLPVLRELTGESESFMNIQSVTVLNVPQLNELILPNAFMNAKDVKLENASLLEGDGLKIVICEEDREDVVVNVKDVGVLPVEKTCSKGATRIASTACCILLVTTVICFILWPFTGDYMVHIANGLMLLSCSITLLYGCITGEDLPCDVC